MFSFTCAPAGAHFFTQFSLQYSRGVHRKIPRRTVSICVHPRGAQNKTLISKTAWFGNSSIAGHLMLNGLMGSDQQTDRAGAE